MTVRVRLFAQLRERAGRPALELDLPEGARVSDALRAAAIREIAAGLPLVMAVNREYAREDALLRPGDELALVPPVSGGAASDPETRQPERARDSADLQETGLPVGRLMTRRFRPGEPAGADPPSVDVESVQGRHPEERLILNQVPDSVVAESAVEAVAGGSVEHLGWEQRRGRVAKSEGLRSPRDAPDPVDRGGDENRTCHASMHSKGTTDGT